MFDIARGIEVLDVEVAGGGSDDEAYGAEELDELRTVRAPVVREGRWASRVVSGGGLVCPILVAPEAA